MKNKLTIPQSILIGSLMIAGTILYTNGFNFSVIPEVKASYHWSEDGHDHDGHDHYDKSDEGHDHSDLHDESLDHYEFYDILNKSSIKKIIENCDGDGEDISC